MLDIIMVSVIFPDEIREYLKKYDKRQKEVDRNVNELFSEYSWSGGLIWIQKEGTRAAAYLEEKDPKITVLTKAAGGKAGSRSVKVDNAKALRVGDVVELHYVSRLTLFWPSSRAGI